MHPSRSSAACCAGTGGRSRSKSGIEGALNVLDSHSSLDEDGVAMPVPNGTMRVEEQRGELFAMASWPLSDAWRIEAGSRFEYSRLDLSGDSNLSKSFFFPKPRVLATWSMSADDRLRLLLEREVGQLDFEDFVGSASLSSSTVTAGNPDLEPDRTWRVEAAWERRFWGRACWCSPCATSVSRNSSIAFPSLPKSRSTPWATSATVGAPKWKST